MKELYNRFLNTIGKDFIGKEDVIESLFISLLAGGHVLLEDVPGVGKTTLAKAFSYATGLDFGRIQFTPDTLPGDVTGFYVYQMQTGAFTRKEGAVMHQLVLADEINRTSPKTQAALLEAMAEEQVTIDGQTIPMNKPFMVIATQNPVEYVGTYALPEAQLDRFLMKLSLGYPAKEKELDIARKQLQKEEPVTEPGGMTGNLSEGSPKPLSDQEIRKMQDKVRSMEISDKLLEYALEIITLTRKDERIHLGASTRAYLALLSCAKAKACLEGRDYCIPDDIKANVSRVLAHRLVLTTKAKRENLTAEKILKELVVKAKVPV